MKWLWENKKKVLAALVAVGMAVWAVLVAVPGDQKEDVIKQITDKGQEIVDSLPDDK